MYHNLVVRYSLIGQKADKGLRLSVSPQPSRVRLTRVAYLDLHMIIAQRLVSLVNSSILGILFQLKRKEIGDFIDKYFTRANPNLDNEIIETDDRNDVLELKSVTDPQNLMYQCVLNTIRKN